MRIGEQISQHFHRIQTVVLKFRLPTVILELFISLQADKDDLINDAAAIAESIQPKGNTLSSTNVVTPVPFLLRHTLREYQVMVSVDLF